MLSYLMMAFFLLMLSFRAFDPLSNALKSFSFTDIYYQILSQTSAPDTSRVVTIVDMTNIYRRGEMAKLFEDIQAANPRVVGVDVVFDAEKDDWEGNDSLIHVAQTYSNMFFSVKYLDFDEKKGEFTKETHSFFSKYTDIKEGFCNVPRGGQYDMTKRNVFRRCKSNGKTKPSLVSQVASAYCGKNLWKDGKEEMQVNFSPMEFKVLTPTDVKKHPELIRDRIVMVGAMYEDTDFHWTPVGKIAGVRLLSYAVQTFLEKKDVKVIPEYMTCITSFFITLLICYFIRAYQKRTNASKNLFIKFLIGSSYVMSIFMFFITSILLCISFLIFTLTNITVNLAWAISSIAFITTSSNLYKAIKEYYDHRRATVTASS